MTDDQRRSHAMFQLRAARELYSETGDSAYLAVIDAHLKTIAEVDERRRVAEARRTALLELKLQAEREEETMERGSAVIEEKKSDSSILKSPTDDPGEFLRLLSQMAEGAETR